MEKNTSQSFSKQKICYSALLCITGLLINLLGTYICQKTGIPLYLDTVGTVFAAVCGGIFPGIVTAFLLTFTKGISDNDALFYCLVGIIMGVCGAIFSKRGFFRNPIKALEAIPVFILTAAIPDSVITWYLYPEAQTTFIAQVISDIKTEGADKALTILIVFVLYKLIPQKMKDGMKNSALFQAPLSNEMRCAIKKRRCRKLSINVKIVFILGTAALIIAASSTVISFILFRDNTIKDHKSVALSIAQTAADAVDGDMIDEYLEKGESVKGYAETKEKLEMLRSTHSDVEYVYVYRIEKDGCHVIFDLDTEDTPGGKIGDIVEFDEDFKQYVPDLIKGRKVEPFISYGAFGWLLTSYQPVYNSSGDIVCYAAADISMNDISDILKRFLAQLISLFIGFFIVIIAISLWFVKSNILLPVNTMAYCAGDFAFNSGEDLEEYIEQLKKLDIRTGDEIENLYLAFVKTTTDTLKYVEDIKEKNETISKMQNGLIMVLADMVENRDKCTGDHVRKTAAYAKIIMNQMKKDGMYQEELNDEFIANVINAAPLHDIGKIHVSDVLLNKPSRLTDEEYELMKKHTTLGSEIIDRAIEMVPDSVYLEEAKNLSEYHHEKWNGTGYPNGISGEEIPLSARIMAVADVFDALVSRRSYKEPFPFEKAMDIIKKDAGTHFDPLIAKAFVEAEDEVKIITERFQHQAEIRDHNHMDIGA
ncbi:MAG: HD domain-containing protein [Ruminococcus sp.]|nr:HD domain-containing protein [Ruminococcus sp.]